MNSLCRMRRCQNGLAIASVYALTASSYFFLDMCAFPAAFSFSAAALSAADTTLGAGAEVEADAAEELAGAASLSFVFRKTSKMDSSVAGLTERRPVCSLSAGSTPKASPMHWTTMAAARGRIG